MSSLTSSFSETDDVLGIFTWIPSEEIRKKLEELSDEDRSNAITSIRFRMEMAVTQCRKLINALSEDA